LTRRPLTWIGSKRKREGSKRREGKKETGGNKERKKFLQKISEEE